MRLTNVLNASFKVRTKMADVVVTIQIMPESPEINLKFIESEAVKKIVSFAKLHDSDRVKVELEPVAFGLEAVKFVFFMDESIGSTEHLEEQIKLISGVNSVETVDVRRAFG